MAAIFDIILCSSGGKYLNSFIEEALGVQLVSYLLFDHCFTSCLCGSFLFIAMMLGVVQLRPHTLTGTKADSSFIFPMIFLIARVDAALDIHNIYN